MFKVVINFVGIASYDIAVIRERSFHLMEKKNANYFRRVQLLHPWFLTGHIVDLYISSFAVL